jgi:ferrous iron transport protein B
MKIALLGNPNSGKSSIFNLLSGMRQQVGNFPGVTVDKKTGSFKHNDEQHTIVDYPGTYSVYPHSNDEKVVYDLLFGETKEEDPDVYVVVLDASNLRRNLFFFSQIYDLGKPIVMVLNMIDIAQRHQLVIDYQALEELFPDAVIVTSNARVKLGKARIIESIFKATENANRKPFIEGAKIGTLDDIQSQEAEAEKRFAKIDEILPSVVKKSEFKKKETFSTKVDKIITHPILGYVIFSLVLITIFQFIFTFSEVPMGWIEALFASLSVQISQLLPSGILSDLIAEGIVPGIGGVVVFVPQIAILFFFLTVLEETGYMARVVFIMDRLMRPFGLNGKSVVPLMSAAACAIPAVMSARTISDWKERMITIFVTPLISCSARIPVYTILIALVIPDTHFLGLNAQGLVLFGLYTLGVVSALVVAWIMQFVVQSKGKGYLLLEMPAYKMPRWENVGITVFEKAKIFVIDAGKIILSISIILWALASYGPEKRLNAAIDKVQMEAKQKNWDEELVEEHIASAQLENSYIGIMGKTIEPMIEPIGYDWKIGISLITSFVAREVFVGSLATIYSVHDDGEDNKTLRQKLQQAKRTDGTPVYTLATGVSLMIFYVFAMQCMATLAVVKRETGSWKWPIYQLVLFGIMAYIGAFIAFNLLS